ncbi:MAG: bis(5'-nucleosyl)-tetraphosphatase [Burkholderiales bacterium]|nr:bis(5'-nucleosyl)-tetraphosphatase [Burkholderiales bacterium]
MRAGPSPAPPHHLYHNFGDTRLTRPNPPRKRAAGIVVLRHDAAGWRVLLLRAFRNWDFPKGLVEAGESPIEAARRETCEETGLTDLVFRWGEAFRETEPYAGGKVARFYLAETRDRDITLPVSAELGRPEHHEWRWASFDEARALLPPRLGAVLDWAASLAEA